MTLHPSRKSVHTASDLVKNETNKNLAANRQKWCQDMKAICDEPLLMCPNVLTRLIKGIKKKEKYIHIHHRPESPVPPPPQPHLLYTNSDTQTLKAAKCQLRSGAVSSQAWHRRLYAQPDEVLYPAEHVVTTVTLVSLHHHQ